jgi:hypothetical protein
VLPMLWQVIRLYEQQPSTQCRLPPVIAVWSAISCLSDRGTGWPRGVSLVWLAGSRACSGGDGLGDFVVVSHMRRPG